MSSAWTAPLFKRNVALMVAAGLLAAGCAARAYRQGRSEARKGNWDVAVARLTKALQDDPDNIKYKIALENARVEASRMHYANAKRHLAADELEKAAEELDIAVKYDGSNHSAVEDLRIVNDRIRRRAEEKQRQSEFETTRTRAQAARIPTPVLSPRSPVPISIRMTETSMDKVFDALAKASGVNIIFDEGVRPETKRISFNVSGVTFEDALDQLTLLHRLFYKVVDQNTVIIIPESAQKRRQYEDLYVQTFYLQNAEVNETVALVTKLAGVTKIAGNVSLGSITAVASADRLALLGRIIESVDKAKGEVVVAAEILEVNRTNLKRYGIELSNYEGSVTFSPTGSPGETSGGFTTARAHLLSSLNLADFVVNIPSTVLARFLQTDSTVKILAAPRLRAAEGKRTELRIGTEVPIPVTTFTAAQAGTTTFAPATSFQYRNVGVTLALTPKVNASGDILLDPLVAEFSLLGESVNVATGENPLNVPTFLTRKVEGILRLRDGQTSLIGGLLQNREADTFAGALGMKSVPLLRKLFGSNQKETSDSEILISLTPHIVRGPKVTEEDLKTLNVGPEEVPRVFGARPPLFGPPEPTPTPSPTPTPPPVPGSDRQIGVVPQPVPGVPTEPTPRPTPVPTPTPPAPAVAPTPAPTPGPTSLGTPATGQPDAPSALMRPAELTLKVGEDGGIDIVLLGAKDLVAVDVVVGFDPTLAEGVEANAGALLTLDGAAVGTERSFEAGRLRARFTRPTPTAGAGGVVTFRLKALRAGTGTVAVQSLTLITASGATRTVAVPAARLTVTP
jgi:general secretion pathway protein D